MTKAMASSSDSLRWGIVLDLLLVQNVQPLCCRHLHGFSLVIPFVIAVLVAVLSRQALAGLALELLAGCVALAPAPVPAPNKFAEYVIGAAADRENLRIIAFLFVFGGLVGMMQVAGGVRGFARLVRRYARSQRSILGIAWGSTIVTFMDCEFRIMTVVPLMKAVKGRNTGVAAKIA